MMPHNATLTRMNSRVCATPERRRTLLSLGGTGGRVAWVSTTYTEGYPLSAMSTVSFLQLKKISVKVNSRSC